MFKLNAAGQLEKADLEKGTRSIGSFFAKQADDLEKSFAAHTAMASHHEAIRKAHSEFAAHNKAMQDGLDKGHELHGHFGKAASHHDGLAAEHAGLHKAHTDCADKCKADMNTIKSFVADWGGALPATSKAAGTVVTMPNTEGLSIEEKLKVVSDAMVSKAIASIDDNPAVAEALQRIVLEQVEKAIGNKLVPTSVSAVAPTAAPFGSRAVPREGQKTMDTPAGRPNVPIQFEKLVSVEDDE